MTHMTSSIKIIQVFPKLVGKKTRGTLNVYRGMLKHMINYALYLSHYDAYFIKMMTHRSVGIECHK